MNKKQVLVIDDEPDIRELLELSDVVVFMKILHMADTHLGYSAYRKMNSEGINQREADIYTSFSNNWNIYFNSCGGL